MAKGRKKKRMPVPLIIVLCVCVAALGVSIWQLSHIFLEYKAGTDEYDELQQYVIAEIPEEDGQEQPAEEEGDGTEEGVEEERVQRVIEIPGTTISYPLMHRDDNAYYLNHTFSGKINSAGSIFMETLNSPDFTDLHTIIYGHNMKNGSMFAGLKNYTSPSYLVAHPNVYLDLADGTHCYQIFSVYEVEAESDSYTIGFAPDEQYETFLQTLKSRSAYDTGVTVTKDDSIITLSTCTRQGEHRYLVHAKKIY